jgi:hypothetical protein
LSIANSNQTINLNLTYTHIMKLFNSSILASIVVAAVSALETKESNTMEARVIIGGLQGKLSPQDVEIVYNIIAKPSDAIPMTPPSKPSLRASNVFAAKTDEEPSVGGGEDESDVMLWRRRSRPAPTPPPRPASGCGGWGCGGYDPNNPYHQRGRWYGFGSDFSCGPLCKNDDALVMETTMATLLVSSVATTNQDGDSEARLCDKLRHSGSSALSHATHCSIAAMEKPSAPTVASLCVDGTKVGEALVFVDGTTSTKSDEDKTDLTDEEATVLEASVKDAYNQAYEKAGLTLTSFRALNTATPPSNSDSTAQESSTVVMGEFHQLCVDDNDHEHAPHTPTDLDLMHRMFETNLCEQLHASGLTIFQNVKHCSFRTFRSPAKVAMKQVAASTVAMAE